MFKNNLSKSNIFLCSHCFCMLSSHVKIRVKRIGIWLIGCAPVAIQRRMGPHFSMSFCVSPLRTENWKNTEQTQNSKIPTGILLLGCLPGAPGCSFYGSLKFEKRTFLKKDPKLKKTKNIKIPIRFSSTRALHRTSTPQVFQEESEQSHKK